LFSKKFQFEPKPNLLYLLLESKKSKGEKIFDLTLSNPLEAGILHSQSTFQRAFSVENFLEYKPHPKGLSSAREIISNYYLAKGRYIHSENIFLSTGTSETVSFLLKLFCDPKDIILVPSPGYPLFDWIAELENVQVETYPCILEEDYRWTIDLDMLKIILGLKPKVLILVQPNNPTGMILSKEDFNKLETLLTEHKVILIVDEVFSDYIWKQDIQVYNPQINGVVMSGISKVLGLPQLKLGWFYFTGESKFIREACEYMEIITDTYLSVSYSVQKALGELFKNYTTIQKIFSKRISSNLETLHSLNKNFYRPIFPLGGWYIPIEIFTNFTEEEFTRKLLEKQNTLVYPGKMFQFKKGKWIVISLIVPEEDFSYSVEKLNSFVCLV
jgi:aspartate/methionine/tyrosine aminotransferase